MDSQEMKNISSKILRVIRSMQTEENTWVAFALVGGPLASAGVQYKEYGYQKLRAFLNEFSDILEFEDRIENGKPPVCYVRPKSAISDDLRAGESSRSLITDSSTSCGRVPTEESWLTTWASIPSYQYKALAKLALEEKWYYGTETETNQEELPILRNYLNYTFKRLCFEKKVLIRKDTERNEEYAAFTVSTSARYSI